MTNHQKILVVWKKLKTIIKKIKKTHQPLNFEAVQNNLKELKRQAELVNKEIFIGDKFHSKPKKPLISGIRDQDAEALTDLFKEED